MAYHSCYIFLAKFVYCYSYSTYWLWRFVFILHRCLPKNRRLNRLHPWMIIAIQLLGIGCVEKQRLHQWKMSKCFLIAVYFIYYMDLTKSTISFTIFYSNRSFRFMLFFTFSRIVWFIWLNFPVAVLLFNGIYFRQSIFGHVNGNYRFYGHTVK